MDIKRLSPLTEASYYILLAFKTENHGYGVIKKVKQMTNDRLVLAAGTLYGVITSLLKNKLIELKGIAGGRSKKTYAITELGTELLELEVDRLKEMVQNAKGVF